MEKCMREAIFGLLGVIIGCILTGLFTWFTDYLKSAREQKIYILRKREETYLKAIDCLISISADWRGILQGDPCNEVKEKINSTIPYVELYTPTKIAKEYIALQKEIRNAPDTKTVNKMEKFIENIKKELKISE